LQVQHGDERIAAGPHLMSVTRMVVVGASAGGIEALSRLASGIPEDFPAPICVVLHTSAESPGVLHGILGRAGPLPARAVRSGERPQPGHIYVAPPDSHLVLEPNRLRLTKGPRENRFRPAIDPLFRSAAQVYGPAAVGVLLTGNLDDGTAGLWAIKQLGGVAIVQDPADAPYPSMPQSAIRHVDVDHVVPLAQIPPLLERVVATPLHEGGAAVPDRINIEVNIAKAEDPVNAGIEQLGGPSPYACPDCHGVLLRLDGGGNVRFRCHTGHAYSAESLLAAINERVEDALWNAVRAIDEGARFIRHVSEHLQPIDSGRAERFASEALEARRQSEAVRQIVTAREALRSE
jgi:two-component system, chemotaxis family, protein-glutamate methylesterase/glutaminase